MYLPAPNLTEHEAYPDWPVITSNFLPFTLKVTVLPERGDKFLPTIQTLYSTVFPEYTV